MVLINQVTAIMSIKRRDPLREYQKQKKYVKNLLRMVACRSQEQLITIKQ
jgi:hypothetical protein